MAVDNPATAGGLGRRARAPPAPRAQRVPRGHVCGRRLSLL